MQTHAYNYQVISYPKRKVFFTDKKTEADEKCKKWKTNKIHFGFAKLPVPFGFHVYFGTQKK